MAERRRQEAFAPRRRRSAPTARRRPVFRFIRASAMDREFWDKEFREPATLFMLKGHKEVRARAREEFPGP
eukprot:14403573-Alexandrium_andersonii.AAC.1